MKKLILLFSVLALASCAYQTAPSASTMFVDVREYTDEGFLITPTTAIDYKYYPLGQIAVIVAPGESLDLWTGARTVSGKMSFKESLDKMVTDAKAMGANGIMDFRFEIVGNYYHIKGFAIQITDELRK